MAQMGPKKTPICIGDGYRMVMLYRYDDPKAIERALNETLAPFKQSWALPAQGWLG